MALDVKELVQVNFADNQYFREEQPKSQIFLHHTAGNPSAVNTAKYWQQDEAKIATAFVISGNVKANNDNEKDGSIIQCFSSKFWAYHLGLKQDVFNSFGVPYKSLDRISVAIEVCNWGQLTKEADGTFKNYVNGIVSNDEVTELENEFKGHKYFHKYTDAQIESLKDLVIFLCDKFGINKTYNDDIFDLTKRAFAGENGIYTHNSVRKDKVDIYPCPRMINMLKNL